jgi:hypothetical protein
MLCEKMLIDTPFRTATNANLPMLASPADHTNPVMESIEVESGAELSACIWKDSLEDEVAATGVLLLPFFLHAANDSMAIPIAKTMLVLSVFIVVLI